MKRPLVLLVAAAVIALVGSGCSSTLSDAATITFTAKGASHEVHVTRDALLSEVGKLVANKPFAAWLKQNTPYQLSADTSADTSISAIWLSTLIRQEAIDELFKSRGLHVSPALQKQAAQDVVQTFPTPTTFPAFDAKFRATLTDRQARTEALFNSYSDTSDAAGQKYFRQHESQFACASGRTVSHILVATQAEAQNILDQLKAGASFQKLAQQDSTDKTSGAQGGLLGCFAKGQFVPAFENATLLAPFDTPVGPVHSQFGYHIILVTHAVASYAASRTQVMQALAQQGQVAAQAAVDGLQKSFKVHLDPRFGTWGLITNGQGQPVYAVTPPKQPAPRSQRETTTTGAATTTLPGAAPGTP